MNDEQCASTVNDEISHWLDSETKYSLADMF